MVSFKRRWTQIAAPELSAAIDDVIGDGWRNDIHELENLTTYLDDKEVLNQFYQVKKTAKQRLADYIKETTGVEVSTDAIFDVQVKRLHAYKRQLLNLLHIIKLYWDLKDNPDKDMVPRVFIFGAKAAPGYHFAKSVSNSSTKLPILLTMTKAFKENLKWSSLKTTVSALRNLSFQQQMSLNKSHWLLKKHLVPQT